MSLPVRDVRAASGNFNVSETPGRRTNVFHVAEVFCNHADCLLHCFDIRTSLVGRFIRRIVKQLRRAHAILRFRALQILAGDDSRFLRHRR
jgi:hypothetical protein